MSRGAPAGGWAWWPPSRRRPAPEEAAAAALLLLLGTGLLLGLGGAGLALGLFLGLALAGAAWTGPRRAPQLPPGRPRHADPFPARPLKGPTNAEGAANGGPRRSLGRNPPSAHFVLPLRRRYPIHQAQYGSLGTLPSICWDGYKRKNRLSTCYSSPVQSPVTVKIARPDSHIGRSPLLEHFSPGSFSFTPNDAQDPCAKEAVMSALKESRKRAMIEEEEEEENLTSAQDNKRRRRGSGESGQSLLEPLVANGMPASMVAKPGSLKRSLLSHGLDDVSSKRSRTSSLSSMSSMCAGGIPSSVRNAIASSYSSSRGLTQLWKRAGQSTSPLSSPASSRSQTPERPSKKARSLESSLVEEKAPQTNSASTPVKADKEVQEVMATETPVTRRSSPRSSSSSDASRKRKRRIQLLTTRHPDSFFTLPPPPQLGYSVSSEDLDADKLATLRRFNKVLQDKVADSSPEPPKVTSSVPSTLSFSSLPAKPTSVTSAAGANPLLESLKKKQGEQSSLAQAAAAVDALQPLTPVTSLDQSPITPATTLEAKPLTLSGPVSLGMASPAASAADPTSSMTTTASSDPGQTPVKPLLDPRPSVLGMLISPSTSQPAVSTTSATPSTTPVLKPLFGPLTKSDGLAFSSNTPVSAVSSPAPPGMGPTLGQASRVPPSTFKPIFGVSPAPTTTTTDPALSAATTTAGSLFTFKQSPQLVPPHQMPNSQPTSATSGFSGLLGAVGATPPASSSAMVSTTPATVSKPVFSFGLSTLAAPTINSTAATISSTSTTVSTAPPFLFGSLPSATASGTTTAAPLFQFGKTTATSASEPTLNSAASLAFSQGPPSGTTGPATSTTTSAATSFSVFGSGAAVPSVPPTTTQQPATLTFGSSSPAFPAAFGAPSKQPPPYPSGANQLTVDAGIPEGQQAASKPGPGGPSSFGSNFSFSGSVAQPATQPAFGSTTQAPFGGSGPLTSFGTKSSSQPAFGATTSIFSFGAATTSAAAAAAPPSFGANTQTTSSSGAGGSIFGGPASSSFTFGASSQPAAAGSAFGPGAAVGGGSTGGPSTGFSFGSGQSGAASPFGSSLAQQPPLGSQNQGTPFGFSIPGTTPESKPAFGGAPTPTFGQSVPAPGGGTAGSALSFGTPITPAFGGAGAAFGPTAPAFSIGAGTKMGTRQRLQARRHNTRKK